MASHKCSICREGWAVVRAHVDGADVYWCARCIGDLRDGRPLRRRAASSGATWAEDAAHVLDDDACFAARRDQRNLGAHAPECYGGEA